jgi:hypothetical protein
MGLTARLLTTVLAVVLIAPAISAVHAQDAAAAPTDPFPIEQIEQLVAPIALYPDALIAQMLMASTYPLDVVQANRWLADQEEVEGEALQTAVDAEEWDDSVKSLVFFPSVLDFMSGNLDWTQDLGDAVLAQQGDVTDAIQRLRDEADAAGALASNEQQRVEKAGDTIVIQPAQPEVVYVPSYDPVQVFADSSPPATQYYPDTYADAVSRYEEGYAAGLSAGTPAAATSDSGSGLINFGIGALAGGLLTAAIMWDDDDDRIYYGGRGYYGAPSYWSQPTYWNNNGWRQPSNISVDRNLNIESGAVNINKGIVGSEINKADIKAWQHNPERRGGVRYRDASTEKRFSAKRKDTTIDRDSARGRIRDGGGKVKAPDLSQVKREGAASGGLAQLSGRRGDGGALGDLKDKRPASGDIKSQLQSKAPGTQAKIQAKAPAAKAKVQAKVQAKAPAVKAKAKTKPKVAAAAKKRPVNTAAKRPPAKQLKRPAASTSKPKIAAKAKARPAAKSSAFKAKAKPSVTRKASQRGGASRAKSGGGKVRRRG